MRRLPLHVQLACPALQPVAQRRALLVAAAMPPCEPVATPGSLALCFAAVGGGGRGRAAAAGALPLGVQGLQQAEIAQDSRGGLGEGGADGRVVGIRCSCCIFYKGIISNADDGGGGCVLPLSGLA